jgi:hypothetical protein
MVPYLKQIREDELAKPKYIDNNNLSNNSEEKTKKKGLFKRLFT